MCDITTDNRNRTASEIRHIFVKAGGELGKTNCVGYLFERKGIIVVNNSTCSLDSLMELALENGAEDVLEMEGRFEISCAPEHYLGLADALATAEIATELKELARVPSSTVVVDNEIAKSVAKLLELLEDHDDVQSVSTNVQFTEEQLAELA